MVERKRFPAPGDYSIAVAAERMKDGKWSAVSTIQQSTPTGERNIDLPISDTRFATEEAGRGRGSTRTRPPTRAPEPLRRSPAARSTSCSSHWGHGAGGVSGRRASSGVVFASRRSLRFSLPASTGSSVSHFGRRHRACDAQIHELDSLARGLRTVGRSRPWRHSRSEG